MAVMENLLRWIAGLATLFLAFTFSLVVFAIVAVVGSLALIWFWWKTRALRSQLKAQRDNVVDPTDATAGQVYEGEVVREVDVRIEHRPSN